MNLTAFTQQELWRSFCALVQRKNGYDQRDGVIIYVDGEQARSPHKTTKFSGAKLANLNIRPP